MQKLNICFITEDFYPNFIGGQRIGWIEYAFYLLYIQLHVHQNDIFSQKEYIIGYDRLRK